MKIPYLVIRSGSAADGKYTEWIGELHAPEGQSFSDSLLFPSGRAVEVRSIRPRLDGEVMLSMKGAARGAVEPGAVLIPSEYDPAFTRTAYGRIRYAGSMSAREERTFLVESDSLPLVPGDGETVTATVHAGSLRITFSRHILLCPGSVCRLVSSGGGKAEFIPVLVQPLPERLEKPARRKFAAFTGVQMTDAELWRFRLMFLGHTRIPAHLVGEILPTLPEGCREDRGFLIRESWFAETAGMLLKKVKTGPGGRIRDIARSMGLADDIVKRLAEACLERNELRTEEGRLYPVHGSSGEGKDLSPAARNILKTLQEAGLEGISLSDPKYRTIGKVVEELERKGYAISLTPDIVYAVQTWEHCISRLLDAKKGGEYVGVQDLKELFMVSRKYALPLLDRLVLSGVLERDEEGAYVKHVSSAEVEE